MRDDVRAEVIKKHTSIFPNKFEYGMSYGYVYTQIIRIMSKTTLEPEVFRVHIVLNDTSWDEDPHRCFGEVDRWNGQTWKGVASLDSDELQILKNEGFQFKDKIDQEECDRLFEADRAELVRIAVAVCMDIDI